MPFAWLGMLAKGFFIGDNSRENKVPPLRQVIEEAKKDWLYAQKYYNYVTDDDLIDYAAYMIKATEKKYSYLLKQARRQAAELK